MERINFETAKIFCNKECCIGSDHAYDVDGKLKRLSSPSFIFNNKVRQAPYEAPYQERVAQYLREKGWHICVYQSNLPLTDPP